jgi:hypothetical protein
LYAYPPAGEPYLIAQDELDWSKPSLTATHDIKLPRGVLIRGKVTDQASHRPLAGSSVQFEPMGNQGRLLSGGQAIAASGDDGVFQIAVPPGKGHLVVFGPTSDYVLEATTERMLFTGKPGGRRYYAHKIVPYDVKAGSGPVNIDVPLRPGRTLRVRVQGPEGQTIANASYVTSLCVHATNGSWSGDSPESIKDGRFELHGLADDGVARVDILDDVHEWGASVAVAGKQAAAEFRVTLHPCGRAKARFVGPGGEPVANYAPNFQIVATPGPHPLASPKNRGAEPSADAAYLGNLDRRHYWNKPKTDAHGRITLPDLIPGALYRINDVSIANDPNKGVEVRKDFSITSGQTLDLGDILIEKPKR